MEPEGILLEIRKKRLDNGLVWVGNEAESLKSGGGDDDDDDLSESSSIVTTEDDGVVGWEELSTGIDSIHSDVAIFLMEKENDPQSLPQSRNRLQRPTHHYASLSARPALSITSALSNDTLGAFIGSPSCSSRFQISPRASAVIFESSTHHLGSIFRTSENTIAGCLEASPSMRSMCTPRNISAANSFFNNPVPKVHNDFRSLEGSSHTSFIGRPPTPRSSAVIKEASEHHAGTSFRRRDLRLSRLQCPEAVHKRGFAVNSPSASGSHPQFKSNNSPSVRVQDLYDDSRGFESHAMHSRSSCNDE